MSALAESRVATSQVDNTNLLKAAAIFLVAIDRFANRRHLLAGSHPLHAAVTWNDVNP
jgi:hypothetical protein